MQYRQQFDSSDCGAACLAMIASYFGLKLNIAKLRLLAGTDGKGTTLKGIEIAARFYKLRARIVKGKTESINKDLYTPFIAHVKNEQNADHFVVIKKITKKNITVYNPDPQIGKSKIKFEDFFNMWTGYAVFLEPDLGFKKSGKKENLLLKFLPIFLPHKKILLFSFLSSVLLLILGLVSSLYYKYIFDEIIYTKVAMSLHTLSFGVLIAGVTQAVINYLRSILLQHFSYKTDLHLNFSYLSHILKLPVSFFETRNAGEIISRLADLDKIKQSVSSTVISGLMDIIMVCVSAPLLFCINKELFSISFISSLLFAKIYRTYYSKAMNENAAVQSYLYECINGISTIKGLDAIDFITSNYEDRKMQSVETNWKLSSYGLVQTLFNGIVNTVFGILVYWIGTNFIIKDLMSIGSLITFNSLLVYFNSPLIRLVNFQTAIQEAMVAAERVGEILELEKESTLNQVYIQPQRFNWNIKFENVSFSYGIGNQIYKQFNLELPSNSVVAFVGRSGCGKSTLIKLILKFYEVQSGRILIDGDDIKDIDTAYLRSNIGYVPQDVFLFSGTIRENICVHKPETPFEEIILAAKISGADDFIQKLPNRYETVLNEHGAGLSGGEKQRIALARALLGKPSLIILDEATSNLDSISEKEIHKVILELKEQHISLILVAHRLTTVKNCDKIFVMEDGTIKESGNHLELLNCKGIYYEMWKEGLQ